MHERFGLPFLAVVLAGCADVATLPASTVPLESVVPEIARQFSTCDLDALIENYAADVEFVSPSTPRPVVGRQVLREHFSGACQAVVRPVMRVDAQRVKMLSPESAVITGTYSFGRTDRPNDKPWSAFFVITLRYDGDRWRVETQTTHAVPGN